MSGLQNTAQTNNISKTIFFFTHRTSIRILSRFCTNHKLSLQECETVKQCWALRLTIGGKGVLEIRQYSIKPAECLKDNQPSLQYSCILFLIASRDSLCHSKTFLISLCLRRQCRHFITQTYRNLTNGKKNKFPQRIIINKTFH